MTKNPETWVAVAFVLFVLTLIYYRVPSMLAKALDARAAAIAKELNEAKALREEAEAILWEYHKRAAKVHEEAAAILSQAEREAEAYGREARAAFDEMIARRMNLAELKIRQEEDNARKRIRAQAAEIAVAAAEQLIEEKVTGKIAEDMISASIERVKKRLH